jgi:hypothetical protein
MVNNILITKYMLVIGKYHLSLFRRPLPNKRITPAFASKSREMIQCKGNIGVRASNGRTKFITETTTQKDAVKILRIKTYKATRDVVTDI